jgi:nucleoside 2-deoxyribosyltransferase
MAKEPRAIKVAADSELGKLVDQAKYHPVLLEKDGAVYSLTPHRSEPEDLKVRKAITATRVYIAGPLFSKAERQWLREVINHLQKRLEVETFWSWEKQGDRTPSIQEIFEICKHGLDISDSMVAILDGPQVDDGTAWEIGYFYAHKKGPIIGLRTDLRKAGEVQTSRVNAMIEGCCDLITGDLDQVVSGLSDSLKRTFR